jgi:N-acetylmuramoyl-L-alanine amidase
VAPLKLRHAAALLSALLVCPPPVAGAATRKAARPAPSPTPDPRPDRTLFADAQRALETLKASSVRQSRKADWEKVIARFRRVVDGYPQSGYCDDALLAVGHLYRQMADRFKSSAYRREAVAAYRSLVAGYPSSRHGEEALFAVFELAQRSGDGERIAQAGRQYLDAFPDAKRARDVRATMRRSGPAAKAALPEQGPRGLAQLFDVRLWSGDSSTRVVLDVAREVKIESDRIQDPDRLWIDLQGTRMHPNLRDRAFPVVDGLLEQIRVAENRAGVVRVVLHFKDVKDHSIFYLKNPTRLVVDVRGAARAPVAPSMARQEAPAQIPKAATLPALWNGGVAVGATPGKTPAREGVEPFDGFWSGPASRSPAPPPLKPQDTGRRPPAVATERVTSEKQVAAALPPPQPPDVNRAGSYSLARQLGLGARRIVIDAGHGGHDPGSIGPGGLQEKELVLDVALRLTKLVREELGADVLLTRPGDVFIPLEERTAIANSRGADLFLSIHANSSRSARSRGVETYFLNFAADPHAEEVAARENAISAGTLKDLQNLVKAITLNSKIDESRDFASSVQESVLANLRQEDPRLPDRGVRTAPFYVLIGANMPSVLAEISFISHPEDEKRLREGDFRQRIAEGLLAGVRSYLQSLDRSGARLTTLRGGSRVVGEARAK